MAKRKVYNVLSIFIIILVIGIAYILLNNSTYTDNPNLEEPDIINEYTEENNLIVEFIDTGQSDSIFIITPHNKTILIDAGESGEFEKINEILNNHNISLIDVVIATHPHADHIGGMQKVIENYEIGKVYMPDVIHTSKTFENLLLAIEDKGLMIDIAEAGVKIDLDSALDLTFVSPNTIFKDDLNNNSAVLRLTYKDTSFLFTGDMETKAEELILDDIDVDVLKVGHHGSDTSSSEEFLERVTPDLAVILVGEENKYNHPSDEVLERLEKIGAEILRTDLHGNITIKSDGENLTIERSR